MITWSLFLVVSTLSAINQANGVCKPIPTPPSPKPVCESQLIQWDSPVNGSKVINGLIGFKHGMNLTTCQDWCYVTAKCKSININDNGYCELQSVIEPIVEDTTMRYSTHQCCQTEHVSCLLKNVTSMVSLGNHLLTSFISWRKSLVGININATPITLMMNMNESSCQEYCFQHSDCHSAVIRRSGECLIMNTTKPMFLDNATTTMIYERCQTVDGAWSEWSAYSTCKMGDVIQSRERRCDNPIPSDGGKYCLGESVEWRDCIRNDTWSNWKTFVSENGQRKRKCMTSSSHGSQLTCGDIMEEPFGCNDGWEVRDIPRNKTNGFLNSRNYPNDYISNDCIQWNFPTNTTVTLTVQEFDLEFDSKCNYDFLETSAELVVQNGVTCFSSRRRCGILNKGTTIRMRYAQQELFVRFKTDHSIVRKGFKIEYTMIESAQKQEIIVFESSKFVTTPNYPNYFPHNVRIEWKFIPFVCDRSIEIIFHAENPDLHDCGDFLKYDSNSYCGQPGNLHWSKFPFREGTNPTVQFRSGNECTHKGFRLHYHLKRKN